MQSFDPYQADEVYKENKRHYGLDQIVSDGDGKTFLHKQNTKLIPHIDHRFPKSKGGSNHYTNAAVIPASTNIKKSDKLEISEEPTKGLPPYYLLAISSAFSGDKVGKHWDFSLEQRIEILTANRDHYGEDTPVSDIDGKTTLARVDTTRVPHIDHITAKGEGGYQLLLQRQGATGK